MNIQAVDVVGVIACVLAAASLLWQGKTWRESNRERVIVRLRWNPPGTETPWSAGTPPGVSAEIVNIGRVPVYLREVVIERNAKGEPPTSFDSTPADGIARLEFRRERDVANPLKVGEAHVFWLERGGTGYIQKFVASKHARLIVRSDRGDLCKIRAKAFRPLLGQFQDAIAPTEEAELSGIRESTARIADEMRQIGEHPDTAEKRVE